MGPVRASQDFWIFGVLDPDDITTFDNGNPGVHWFQLQDCDVDYAPTLLAHAPGEPPSTRRTPLTPGLQLRFKLSEASNTPTFEMAFAAPSLRIAPAGSAFLSRLIPATVSSTPRTSLVLSRQLSLPLLPSLVLSIPAIQLSLPSIPSLLEGIWESILRAVPKKKTSHMKKRHRQMAGKALKDVTALCKCPACGQSKRMHYLCPNCASSRSPFLRDPHGTS